MFDEYSGLHDEFFRFILSQKEILKEFVIYLMPSDLVDVMDIESIEICNESNVDKNLKRSISDLKIKAKICGDETYFYSVS